MTERVTRSKTGKTPSKPFNPGFVETPGRKKYARRSIVSSFDSGDVESDSTSPEPLSGDDAHRKVHVKGNLNGYSNGTANGYATGAAIKAELGAAIKAENKEKEHIKELDNPAVDTSHKTEFGGSLGMSAMMIGFPMLMYYMWIGAFFYDGKFPTPGPDQDWFGFFEHLVNLVRTEAYPSHRAWSIYWYFGLVQMAFYMLLPGVYRKGKPLPHLKGKQLDYYCSAMWSFYTSIALGLVLHFTGVFKLYTLIDQFGPILSVAIISGFLCSLIAYVSAYARGSTLRMTGYPIYDFFLGAELNPRLFGILDFKMFLEVRIPWFMMFFMALGTCMRQYESYGYVSGEACFLLLAQYLYAGACAKGEHLIITTWDMYYEKLGFMLIFWNMAGVPLSYCHCILYVAQHHPDEYQWPTWFIALLIVAYIGVYYVWDTCNSQKNQFRQEERGIVEERTTFPYFKYGRIANPKTIPTKHGNKILCDGWYGKARKVHYACDFFFAVSWGLITGFKSPFPWFYSVFFAGMIVHRARRDFARCRETYGEAWAEYERLVPYLFIPGIF